MNRRLTERRIPKQFRAGGAAIRLRVPRVPRCISGRVSGRVRGLPVLRITRACPRSPGRPSMAVMQNLNTAAADPTGWHGTTILCVRRDGQVAMAGDGQVSLGQTIVKGNARKVRRIGATGGKGGPGGYGVLAG